MIFLSQSLTGQDFPILVPAPKIEAISKGTSVIVDDLILEGEKGTTALVFLVATDEFELEGSKLVVDPAGLGGYALQEKD
jgi:hypothetical protein